MASLLRVAIFAVPIALSFVATYLIARNFPPHEIGFSRLTWWIGIAAIGLITLIGADHLARRFLPLTTLLRLSLVFPDEAPSRYRRALRSGTTTQLRRRIEAHRAEGTGSTEVGHGQYMLDLVEAVNLHDRATRGHSERVRAYTMMIAEEMGMPDSDQEKLQWAALLHDVGKLDVPAEILNKDGRPDDEEWEILTRHPAAAIPYLEPLEPWLGGWLKAADEHHLRWDGQGYPADTAGTDISLAGRIVAVADAYDVMTSARSYKKPMPAEDARSEIARCAGGQFDPAVTRAFLNLGLGKLRLTGGPLAWLGHTIGFESAPIGLGTAVAGTAAQVSIGVAAAMGGVITADVVELGPPPAVAYAGTDSADVVEAGSGPATTRPASPTETRTASEPTRTESPADGEAEVPNEQPGTSTPAWELADLAPVTATTIPYEWRSSTTTLMATTTTATTAAPTTSTTATTAAPTTSTTATTAAPTASTTTTTAAPTTSTTTTTAATTTTTTTAATTTTTEPPGAGPTAVDDFYAVSPSGVGVANPLANDEAGFEPILPNSLRITQGAAHGTAVLSGANIRYEPDDGFVGVDRVGYEVCDFVDLCDTAIIEFTVS